MLTGGLGNKNIRLWFASVSRVSRVRVQYSCIQPDASKRGPVHCMHGVQHSTILLHGVEAGPRFRNDNNLQ